MIFSIFLPPPQLSSIQFEYFQYHRVFFKLNIKHDYETRSIILLQNHKKIQALSILIAPTKKSTITSMKKRSVHNFMESHIGNQYKKITRSHSFRISLPNLEKMMITKTRQDIPIGIQI